MAYRPYSNKPKKNSHRINVTRKYIRELLILDFVDYAYVYKKKKLTSTQLLSQRSYRHINSYSMKFIYQQNYFSNT